MLAQTPKISFCSTVPLKSGEGCLMDNLLKVVALIALLWAVELLNVV